MTDRDHDDYGGLARDLPALLAAIGRRRALGLIGSASLLPIVGCGDDGGDGGQGTGSGDGSGSGGGGDGSGSGSGSGGGLDTSTGAGGGSSTGMGTGSEGESGSGPADSSSGGDTGAITDCDPIPSETAGPYPGDGTNGPNALSMQGVVRSDITSSIGAASGVADGVPLTMRLYVVDANGACAPLAGYAVYAWQCDRAADYSMYTGAATQENYLRGVQAADENGEITFVSIFPGCYPGRWPHVHFEIYESLEAASSGANAVHTSQLAFPEDACTEAYGARGYESSVTNLANVSLATDGVFADGADLQLASMSGNRSDGFVATLVIGVPT